MGRVLVIGDLHGNHKGLIQALEKAGFDYENDTLISLGDIVDGHNESFEVVEELLKIKNLIAIKGNHDDWFNDYLTKGIHGSHWQQGALATNLSYLNGIGKSSLGGIWTPDNDHGGLVPKLKVSDIPQSHIELFNNQLPYYIDDKNRLFIHGGFDRKYKLEEQDEFNFWWDRDLWKAALSYQSMIDNMSAKDLLRENPKFNMVETFEHIYIGHTSTQFQKVNVPMTCANITNMDTGGGWHGYVSIMDVNNGEYWQSDSGKELYPDFKGR